MPIQAADTEAQLQSMDTWQIQTAIDVAYATRAFE